MDADRHTFDSVTEAVIGCAFRVSNDLGCGFLEKVYENALAFEVREAGLGVQQQHAVNVVYRGEVVGHYVCDLLIEGKVLVELKVAEGLDDVHLAVHQLSESDRIAGVPAAQLWQTPAADKASGWTQCQPDEDGDIMNAHRCASAVDEILPERFCIHLSSSVFICGSIFPD